MQRLEHYPTNFQAKVVSISDGDTLTVLLNRRQYKVRLSGIDAPESGQDFGTKAKNYLGDLIHEKIVSGICEETDKYGRNVCLLEVDGRRVDYEMLKAGLAWHYVKYSRDPQRQAYEDQAKLAKLNIWSESGPIPPWDWRKWGADKRKQWVESKTARPPPTAKTSLTQNDRAPLETTTNKQTDGALSHWLNSSSNVRHNASCRWYKNTKSGHMCGPNDGKPCGKCGG